MDPQEQISLIRKAQLEAMKAQMKTAQGKRLVPFIQNLQFLVADAT